MTSRKSIWFGAIQASAMLAASAVLAEEAPPIPQRIIDNGVVAGMFCGTGQVSYCEPNSTEGKGLLADINKAWAKEAGVKIRIEGQTWEALLASAVAGRTDMVAGVGDMESRHQQFTFVDAFYDVQTILVQNGNPKAINGWGDLCGKTVSSTAGSGELLVIESKNKSDCVEKGKEPIKTDLYGEQSATFIAVQTGRADATLTDMFGAAQLVKDHPEIYQEAFRQRAETVWTMWGIAVPTDDPELLALVKYGFKKGLESGSLQAVMDQYGAGDILIKPLTVNGKAVD